MSQLLSSISEIPQLSSGARRALVALVTFRNKTSGRCYPKLETLAKRLGGPSERTVYRWLAELRRAGILEAQKDPADRRRNSYVLHTQITDRTSTKLPDRIVTQLPDRSVRYRPSPPLYEQTVLNRRRRNAPPPLSAQMVERKNPGREQGPLPVIQASLRALAREVGIEPPDDGIARMVIAAAPGVSGDEIHATLVALWKAGRMKSMRSWGLVPVLVQSCFAREGLWRQAN